MFLISPSQGKPMAHFASTEVQEDSYVLPAEEQPTSPLRSESGVFIGSHPEHRISLSVTVSDNSSEVFALRFSPDGRFLATGCGDGSIRVFNVQTGRLSYNLQGGSTSAMPTTCIRWRPPGEAEHNRTKNVLIASSAAGLVQHWHVTSGKLLHTTRSAEKNQLLCLDYNPDGSAFVTGGKDKTIRVHDEDTKEEVTCMQGGPLYSSYATSGHSNRVFTVKFYPNDPHLILSGGWDNTVQIWDTRVGHAVRSIFGPHICGDALDLDGDKILTGSWRPQKQLEIWDFATGRLIEQIQWTFTSAEQTQACLLYAAQFSKASRGPKFIAAGGSGTNEAKIFDHSAGNKLVGTVAGLTRGVFTIDWSPTAAKLAMAGGDSTVRILDVLGLAQDSQGDE